MRIRTAREEDAAAIGLLIASLSHYFCEGGSGEVPVWFADTITAQAIRDRIASDRYLNLVFLHDNELAGYIAIQDGNHLYHLFVAAEYQGNGIARQLWEYARNLCPRERFTVRSSLYAVPVYARFGFRVTGPAGLKDGIAFQPMEAGCGGID